MRIAIALSAAALPDETWTTVHLAHAALSEGHEIHFLHPDDMEVTARGALTVLTRSRVGPSPGREVLATELQRQAVNRQFLDLALVDLLLLRISPPTSATLRLGVLAQERGVNVVNDPLGILRTRSKAWLATLPPDVPRPRSIATHRLSSAHQFRSSSPGPIVVKPSTGSGGHGVSLVRPSDPPAMLDAAVDRARAFGDSLVVIQEYVAEASEGEKRLVWVDGQLVSAYRRLRAPGEFRHNLKQGGIPEPADIDEKDLTIARALHPHLVRNGIRIAGLDVIGESLIEVNTANPGGLHHASRLSGGEPRDGDRDPDHLSRLVVRSLVGPPRHVAQR